MKPRSPAVDDVRLLRLGAEDLVTEYLSELIEEGQLAPTVNGKIRDLHRDALDASEVASGTPDVLPLASGRTA
jgi:hypothetical protein